jgi:hypothetical protein
MAFISSCVAHSIFSFQIISIFPPHKIARDRPRRPTVLPCFIFFDYIVSGIKNKVFMRTFNSAWQQQPIMIPAKGGCHVILFLRRAYAPNEAAAGLYPAFASRRY